ncbi:MAG: GNAT family N-acetyltransferase [Verrucomicrobiaceae bacterium]|nr:GNAT family N-acetyltransferase [Verrucomicrobiaceae bacterium]
MELDDAFMCDAVPAEVMDGLWAGGWRHFGRLFFRYSKQQAGEGITQTVTPLRIRLNDWSATQSQRRVLRWNADLRTDIVPAVLDDGLRRMFERHKERFRENVPEALENFLGDVPEKGPCDCRMLRVFEGERLVAASFFDVGRGSASSVYAMFEPDVSRRSPGIFTMLLEIAFARAAGMVFLYPGYATRESSAYDYKKQFRAMEWLDFPSGEWRALD